MGQATIEKVYDGGLIHRVIYVLAEDSAGEILLQKRGPDVINYPNRWDVTAAGHVDAGEDYEVAARRELSEEVGISGNIEFEEVAYFYSEEEHYGRLLHRFNKIYKIKIPKDTPLKFQVGEVSGAEWFTLTEIKEMINSQPELMASGAILTIEKCYPT